MKFPHKYLLVPALLSLALSEISCNKDFLELQPKGYTIARTTSDYEQLLALIRRTVNVGTPPWPR